MILIFSLVLSDVNQIGNVGEIQFLNFNFNFSLILFSAKNYIDTKYTK